MKTRLIVKNLPTAADEKRLRTHFGREGDITDIRVLRKKCVFHLCYCICILIGMGALLRNGSELCAGMAPRAALRS